MLFSAFLFLVLHLIDADTFMLSGSFIGFFLVFQYLFIFLLVYYRVEKFVQKKVTQIYTDLAPSDQTTKSQIIKTDMEALSKSLKKFASDRKLEIELLKDQENYRKEFIGNISHELKTPLFTIQGYILTLLEGTVKDKKTRQKYLKRTSKGVDRLIYIIRDLDLITQFESGVKTIDRKAFDIISIINTVFELLEIQAVKSKISLELDREYKQPILVYADAQRISQVLTNLLTNSLKYGVEHGTTEVSIKNLTEDKILVRVTDNGEGIEKDHLPRLFERFYRVDKSGSRFQGGSGLGLAIVKHIIEAHQEKIFIESTPGVGSEFSFTLQRATQKQIEAQEIER